LRHADAAPLELIMDGVVVFWLVYWAIVAFFVHLLFLNAQFAKILKRLPQPPRGLPYDGLTYPDTQFRQVNHYRYIKALRKEEAATDKWLTDNPERDEPPVSKIKREASEACIWFWVFPCVAAASAGLNWLAVYLWPHLLTRLDQTEGTRYYLHPHAYHAPHPLVASAIFLTGAMVLFALLTLVVWIIGYADPAMKGWREWKAHIDEVEVAEAKLEEISEEIANQQSIAEDLAKSQHYWILHT
jgi:hypothetical protein